MKTFSGLFYFTFFLLCAKKKSHFSWIIDDVILSVHWMFGKTLEERLWWEDVALLVIFSKSTYIIWFKVGRHFSDVMWACRYLERARKCHKHKRGVMKKQEKHMARKYSRNSSSRDLIWLVLVLLVFDGETRHQTEPQVTKSVIIGLIHWTRTGKLFYQRAPKSWECDVVYLNKNLHESVFIHWDKRDMDEVVSWSCVKSSVWPAHRRPRQRIWTFGCRKVQVVPSLALCLTLYSPNN